MKKIKIFSLFVCLAMLVIACHNDDDERGVQMRTVLVYIAGDNSLRSFATEDLAEMTEGMQSVDDNSYNLLVYIDTGSSPKLIKSSSEIILKYIKGRQAIATSGILCYDCRSSKYYYDFDGLIRSLGSETSEYEAWKAAYDAAVVYWKTTPNNYSSYGGSFSMNGSAGLSTYIFRQSYEEEINPFYRQSIQWYSAAGWDETGW